VYTNLITGPRRERELYGPEEFHVLFLDNGRSNMLGTDFEEALYCIRCGACLNVCPVYRQVGGHAYGSTYSGPIGAVVTPLLKGMDGAKDLHLVLRDQGAGEVVVAMQASGMCGSDLHVYRATGSQNALGFAVSAPAIAGHEPCGVVAEVGPAVNPRFAQSGARVMVHHYFGCGVCHHCRTGWSQMCTEGAAVYGVTHHGGHAPFIKVPASTLVPLPDELSFETGAAISCGTGTAYGALRRIHLSGRDTIAIVGQGPVGLSATQFAVAMGARVIAVDINAARLDMAREHGASEVIDSSQTDPVRAVKDHTEGEGADASIDCTGHSEAPD